MIGDRRLRHVFLGLVTLACAAMIVYAALTEDVRWTATLPMLAAAVVGRFIGQRRERRRAR